MKYLVLDRDGKFAQSFQITIIESPAGVEISCVFHHTSPNLNAFAERFVRSIKQECLNQLILFGEPVAPALPLDNIHRSLPLTNARIREGQHQSLFPSLKRR